MLTTVTLCTKSLECALCCESFHRNSVKWTLFIRLSGATTMNSLKLELMKVRLLTFMWQTKRRTLHVIFYHVHIHTRPSELAHPQHHKQNLNRVLSTWEHFDSFITIWKRRLLFWAKRFCPCQTVHGLKISNPAKHGSETLCGIWTVIQTPSESIQLALWQNRYKTHEAHACFECECSGYFYTALWFLWLSWTRVCRLWGLSEIIYAKRCLHGKQMFGFCVSCVHNKY